MRPDGRTVLGAALACTALVAAGCAVRHPTAAPPPADADKAPIARAAHPAEPFEGSFRAALEAAPAGTWFPALIDLTEQVDLPALGATLRSRGLSKEARRDAVVEALESVAEAQQSRLQPLLEGLSADGTLGSVRRLAIVNRLAIEAQAPAILAIAGRPEVRRVLPEWTSAGRGRAPLASPEPAGAAAPGERFRSWAIEAIGADRAWALGFDGAGVVVAALDTGVLAEHEQFAGRALEGERGWYDPVEGRERPWDSHGHGTTVLSQAVGGNPGGHVVGIAPRARWAAALANHRNHYSRVRMSLAADWVLRSARPDVLVNAWSHDEGACSDFDLAFINAWKAAEIFVVFPAGNGGPRPGSGEAPAQLTGAYPDGRGVFAVGGLEPGGMPGPESSRGPSPCGNREFPTLAAPGTGLPYAFPPSPSNYGSGDGTSLAAGIVAGAAALLLQARPSLSPDELEDLLVASARDVPPGGPDPLSGAGALDLVAAFRRLGIELPPARSAAPQSAP